MDSITQEFKKHITTEKFKGVDFFNIDPFLGNYEITTKAMRTLANLVRLLDVKPTKIAGCESRGFILAGYMSRELEIPCSMIRKAGKLPGEVYSVSYDTEYSKDAFEVCKSAFTPEDRVLILDDVLATGGTAQATCQLVEKSGARVVCCAFLIELVDLFQQFKKLTYPYTSLIKYRENSNDNKISNIVNKIKLEINKADKIPITILYHPSMTEFVKPLRNIFNVKEIKWNKFPDGTLNVTFPDDLRNEHVVFIGSMHKPEIIHEQFMLNTTIPRQGVKSFKMVYPYFPGTMERVPKRGILATAETLMASLTKPMTHLNKQGPSSLCIYDIHALPEQFYAHDNVRIELLSAVPELLKRLSDDFVIVFPDEGACKRFGEQFSEIENYDRITCSKVRIGDKRSVVIKDKILNKNRVVKRAIIVDDLVQTGGTLHQCAKVLREEGFVIVDAFVTHAIFPNQSYLDFLEDMSKNSIDKFYVCDTVPGTENLPKEKFEVISIIPNLVRHIFEEYEMKFKTEECILLSSKSCVKTKAITKVGKILNFCTGPIIGGNVSNVNPQPFGIEEIEKGCLNRITTNDTIYARFPTNYHIGIENGIIYENGKYYDIACIMLCKPLDLNKDSLIKTYTRKVEIPAKYFELSRDTGFQKTVGQFIAEEYPEVTHDDWHILFGGRTRGELIVEALC